MNEFIEKFDLKEYTKFFKEAFKKADLIAFIVSHYRDYCSHFVWI